MPARVWYTIIAGKGPSKGGFLMEKKRSKAFAAALIVAGALTAAICLIMNLWLIPAIESAAGGLKAFDMRSFGYTTGEAREFLGALSEEGRQIYLTRQLPLDFVYPVCYTAFFVLSILALTKKRGRLWVILPALLAAFDYAENSFILSFLKKNAAPDVVGAIAGGVTAVKSLLMTAVFVLLAVLFVLWVVRRAKQKKARA
jgi:hypothetical protein